jgi:hypothetical protein
MNYLKIHDKLINYIRFTPLKERITNRNKKDPRLSDHSIYVEIHHIIPRSLGGKDDNENLIEVLPEEHIFLHMIRYKIFNRMEDMWAVRFMLNGYSNPNKFKKMNYSCLTKKIRMGYSWIRCNAYNIRKSKKWHTESGLKRISMSKKNNIVVKDSKTNKIIGLVPTNHPNVISKEWVHHSKGRVQSQKEIDEKRIKFSGQNNPNASGLSEEYFIKKGLEAYQKFGRILSWQEMLKLSELEGFKWIKSLKSRFNKTGAKGYYYELEKITNDKYKPHFTKSKAYAKNQKI